MTEPSVGEQEALVSTRARVHEPTGWREVVSMVVLAAGFALAMRLLLALDPPHRALGAMGIYEIILMAAALRIKLETPYGFCSAGQLAFVTLALEMPVSLVPVGALCAVCLSALPELVRGRMAVSRIGNAPGNAWFALGPAFVLALAGARTPEVLVAALAAQCLCDFAAYRIGIYIARGAGLRGSLSDCWGYLFDAALSAVGLVFARETGRSPVALAGIIPLLGIFELFARERSRRFDGLIKLSETYRGTALLLGDVVEADDGYTGAHSQGVVELALAVGDVLGLGPDRRRNLEFAALLHDVGKIAIPKSIINKPGRLTDEEFAIVQTHCVQGQRMLARVGGFMTEVGVIVRSHHERWDGGGYPDGLTGDVAPLEARIVTCCDSWNAMRTDRPYRQALSLGVARAQIIAGSGSQFDPVIAQALLQATAAEAVGLAGDIPEQSAVAEPLAAGAHPLTP